jgi:ADP-heptose:LPS heptosyltransferase
VIYQKQLGDVLMMEPALAKLAAFNRTPVRFSTRKAFAPMVSLMENVCFSAYAPFRRASAVYSFSERPHAALKTLLTRSKQKHLFVIVDAHLRPWHPWVYPAGCHVESKEASYRAEHFFNNMPCPAAFPFRPPQLLSPPGNWLPTGLPSSYILLHATAAWQQKSWPADRWAQVLDGLHDAGAGPFVLTGGTAAWEREFVHSIRRGTRARVVDVAGRTTLQNYLAINANARMVLCIDGSATHLASAFRRPMLTLFGPTLPSRWFYPSRTSSLIDARSFSPEMKPAVDVIPVAPVLAAALALWKESEPLA